MIRYEQWIDACLEAGIPALRPDTCCRLMAILHTLGASMECFTQDRKILADVRYAQKRLNLLGGETPDPEWLPVLQGYVRELEEFYNNAPYRESDSPLAKEHPQWVRDFMRERYGITRLWI